jgi:hypothetical protein
MPGTSCRPTVIPLPPRPPGAWVFSSTGLAGRPLHDGSWDGWVYASDPLNGPREPVAAIVPEPATAVLLMAGPCLWLACRRRTASARTSLRPASSTALA